MKHFAEWILWCGESIAQLTVNRRKMEEQYCVYWNVKGFKSLKNRKEQFFAEGQLRESVDTWIETRKSCFVILVFALYALLTYLVLLWTFKAIKSAIKNIDHVYIKGSPSITDMFKGLLTKQMALWVYDLTFSSWSDIFLVMWGLWNASGE